MDLVVESVLDRESRVIEMKWVCKRSDLSSRHLDEVLAKQYPSPRGYRLSFFLTMSKPPTKGVARTAELKEVGILSLPDLF